VLELELHNDGEDGLTLERPAVAGPFVAYELVQFGRYNGEGTIVKVFRLNAKTGRREQATEAGQPAGEGICDGGLPFKAPGVTGMTVTPRGTVAWIIGGIVESPGVTNLRNYRVCILLPGARVPIVAARGTSIAPRSLAAVPGYVYWSEGGSARSVTAP
jgi:hypothetical protein